MLKNILTLILIFAFTIINLNAQDKKQGKFLGGKTASMPTWFQNSFLDFNEDIEELKAIDKKLILFVHQDNCPYCHKFITQNLNNKEIKAKIQKNFGVVDINMFGNKDLIDTNGEEYTEKDFAIKHKIQFTPTLIFFDKKGKQTLRINGYIDEKTFDLALDYIKDDKENIISFREYIDTQKKLQISNFKYDKNLIKSTSNFIRTAKSKKMAIFFESKNCSECETIHNKLLKDKDTKKLLESLDLYHIDLDSNKSIISPNKIIIKIKDWVKKLDISHNPTIIFFDENANEIIRIESIFKNFHFQTIVDYVISDEYKTQKEFQRYLTKRANAIREKGIDVNIWD